MPTYPKNRITRSPQPASVFADAKNVISSAVSWNEGDLCYFDDAANLVKPLGSDANAATACGIAVQTIVSGKPVSPYQGTSVDAAQAIETIAGPMYGVIAKMILKTGDAFAPGDLVYWGGDAQTVSSAGTNAVGIYQDVAKTAAAGDQGEVLIANRLRFSTI